MVGVLVIINPQIDRGNPMVTSIGAQDLLFRGYYILIITTQQGIARDQGKNV
jgi:hypothetical protein